MMKIDELKMRIIKDIDEYAATTNPNRYDGMSITQMREYIGLNKAQFSRKYEIPIRTLESWESGERMPASYIMKLLERAVKEDTK